MPESVEERYWYFKQLLGEEYAKLFSDNHAFAYVEDSREFEGGRFVHFATGYNCDQHVSYVELNGRITKVWEYYCGNYSGYRCYCTPDLIIHEDVGYGFGSWSYRTYDINGTLLEKRSEQDHGCCCD